MTNKSDSRGKVAEAKKGQLRPVATVARVVLPEASSSDSRAVSSSEMLVRGASSSEAPGNGAPSSEALVHAPGLELPTHPGVPLSPTGVIPESDVRTHAPGAAANPQQQFPLLDERLGELPRSYGDGRFVCMVRDPSTLFVYWDFSPAQLEQAFGGQGASRAVLKLFTLRGEPVREVEIHLEGRGWYIPDLPPSAELRVELWALGATGSRLLRKSRSLRLPPAVPSGDLSAQYAHLPLDAPLPRELSLGPARTHGPLLGAGWLARQKLLDLGAQEKENAGLAGRSHDLPRRGSSWQGNGSGKGL